MYEKLVTFEEEKRKEHLYLLFNSIFVCACLMPVFEAVFKFPLSIFSGIQNDAISWFLTTLLYPVCSSGAVLLPFFIYNVRMQKPLRDKLKKSKGKASVLWYVFGIISVAAIVPVLVYVGQLFCDFLISRGYVLTENLPDLGDSIPANIFSTVYTSAVSAVLLELAFRGVAAEKLSYANTALAVILPALISAMYTYSFIKIPYLFVTGLIIGWCYLKTKSLYLTIAMNFAANIAFCVILLVRENTDIAYISIIGAMLSVGAFVFLAIKNGLKVKYPEPKDSEEEYERLTKKEAFFGTFKAFAFWIFVFMFFFQVFFTYLDKPMREAEDSNENYQSSSMITEE